MGWTSYYPGYGFNRKEEVLKIFTGENENGSWKPLKISFHGSTAYLAVERRKPSGERYIFGAVVLTRLTKDGEFFYKDMDETVGPFECDCPVSILKMLSPTDNEYANTWRRKCYDKARLNKIKRVDENALNNLPVGSQISFEINGRQVLAAKTKWFSHKRPIWQDGQYRYTTKTIEHCGYTVVKK